MDVAPDNQLGGGIATKEAAQMSSEPADTCEDCENTHYLYVREYGACGCSCHSTPIKKHRDIIDELSEMMSEEKRKAFDAGAFFILNGIITLSEISGGRLYTRQLRDYQDYMHRSLERTNREIQTEAQQQANAAPVQSVPQRPDPEVVVIARDEPPFGPDVPDEASESRAGQASEAVTQAEPKRLVFDAQEWQKTGDVGDNSQFFKPAEILCIYANGSVCDVKFDDGRISRGHNYRVTREIK